MPPSASNKTEICKRITILNLCKSLNFKIVNLRESQYVGKHYTEQTISMNKRGPLKKKISTLVPLRQEVIHPPLYQTDLNLIF